MPDIGSKAPPFRLVGADGRPVTLEDFAGRWLVLYFYPKDDTPGCTVEACEFTASLDAFEALDAAVVGVSPDSPERHRAFAAKHGLKVRLLSDPERKTLAAYGAWGEKLLYGKRTVGVVRSTVIVGPEGRIARRWAKVRAKGHAASVREALEAIRRARHDTEVESTPRPAAEERRRDEGGGPGVRARR
jgi:peroxiredoxin Q/BCP